MLIGGLQKTTLVDYPGKIAATIFTIGCNFRCSFCHNPDIVKGIAKVISVASVLDFLKKRKKLIDAVCLTGGEPTLQPDLIPFIEKIRKMGYLVKLDTNGHRPNVIEALMKRSLIDYIAMDIKSPWKKYRDVVIREPNLENIKKSATIIKKGAVPYEFRSTVLPKLHSARDIVAMARQIKGADKYFIQQFRVAPNLVNPAFLNERTYTRKELNDIIQEFKDWFKICRVR